MVIVADLAIHRIPPAMFPDLYAPKKNNRIDSGDVIWATWHTSGFVFSAQLMNLIDIASFYHQFCSRIKADSH
jgi:hypothetical protein